MSHSDSNSLSANGGSFATAVGRHPVRSDCRHAHKRRSRVRGKPFTIGDSLAVGLLGRIVSRPRARPTFAVTQVRDGRSIPKLASAVGIGVDRALLLRVMHSTEDIRKTDGNQVEERSSCVDAYLATLPRNEREAPQPVRDLPIACGSSSASWCTLRASEYRSVLRRKRRGVPDRLAPVVGASGARLDPVRTLVPSD